ncbi:hypothetical protein, partial [Streptomyces sp. SID3343]|uniref:hypothetical protein n=1 Tax=Streptomyces sp. SID3343 TaxID=2690260 RepID=UPI0013BEFCFC
MPPVHRWSHLRGPRARDSALAVLAFGLPAGAGLIPGGGPDLLPAAGPSASRLLLFLLLAARAAPLLRRRTAPGAALSAVSAVTLLWLACDRLGWTAPDSTDLLLWCWWADLLLLATLAATKPADGLTGAHIAAVARAGRTGAGPGRKLPARVRARARFARTTRTAVGSDPASGVRGVVGLGARVQRFVGGGWGRFVGFARV